MGLSENRIGKGGGRGGAVLNLLFDEFVWVQLRITIHKRSKEGVCGSLLRRVPGFRYNR